MVTAIQYGQSGGGTQAQAHPTTHPPPTAPLRATARRRRWRRRLSPFLRRARRLRGAARAEPGLALLDHAAAVVRRVARGQDRDRRQVGREGVPPLGGNVMPCHVLSRHTRAPDERRAAPRRCFPLLRVPFDEGNLSRSCVATTNARARRVTDNPNHPMKRCSSRGHVM